MSSWSCNQFRFLSFKGKKISVISVRLCSIINQQKPILKSNPFKKRNFKQPIKVENESRIANRILVTILGNGGIGQPRCVGLFTDLKSYLFNCGEGVGRYCREYDINMCLIKHVFITQKRWENVSGLSDIYITNKTYGVYSVNLYGPPNVETFQSMLIHSKSPDTNLVIKKEANYIDHTLNIEHIPILPQNRKLSSPQGSNEKKEYVTDHSSVVYSYVCQLFEKPGDFLVEKCVEYGVPVGPYLIKLKNGENITLPCGKTIYAKDVHGSYYPGGVILIVDCPSEVFLESFINEKKFETYQLPLNTSTEVFAVFHFTPSHIFNSAQYRNWMNRFHQDTQHYALNSDCPIIGSKVVHQTQKYLNMLHSDIFSKLRDGEVATQKSPVNSNIIYPLPMTQIYFRPEKKFEWFNVVNMDPDSVNVAVDGTDIVAWSSESSEKVDNLKAVLQKKLVLHTQTCKIYPEVVFLGTSSATSTAYRNVSAILVNTCPDNSILLDCGEGTVMQFTRCYGSDLDSILRKISVIFVSHIHTDHYMGLFELVSQRLRAFVNSSVPYRPVVLVLPSTVKKVFIEFSKVFENLYSAVRIYKCKTLDRKLEKLKPYLGNVEIFTVPVIHCHDAHGIIIESGSEWKIVYSGDTAPCQKLIDAGKDCTLLIHEASIDDGLVYEAVSKKHSTPTQVIDISEKMNAQYTIMTHFSKRYLPVPVTPECNFREIGYAYDFMKVRMCDLHLLPLFTPVIKSLFKENLSVNEEKSSSVSNLENVFFKVLKS